MTVLKVLCLCILLSVNLVLNADAPNYWLQVPDAYKMPKRANVELKWRSVKKSDLPQKCIEQMYTEIKNPQIAEIDLNSDGKNELIINARHEDKIRGEYYIFMKRPPPYSSSAPEQYCLLYYKGICGDQLIIFEKKNGFYQILVFSRCGMRYKSFEIYSAHKGDPIGLYILSRQETHDFEKFQVNIKRGKLWGDYPDESFVAALEHCLRTVLDKHYLEVDQESLKIFKRKGMGTEFICRRGKEILISIIYGKPGLNLRCPNKEFKINSLRSLYYCYRETNEQKVISQAIKNFVKSYKYISFADRLADKINRYFALKDYLMVINHFEYFIKHYPSNKKLPKILFKAVDAAIEFSKKAKSAWGKYWRAVSFLYRAAEYLSGDDLARVLYRMWGIQCAIKTPESLKLAEGYRRKIEREQPDWKWSKPHIYLPPRTSKLYTPELVSQKKVGKSATLERFRFNYAFQKTADLLVLSIPFNKKNAYEGALGKSTDSDSKPPIEHICFADLTVFFRLKKFLYLPPILMVLILVWGVSMDFKERVFLAQNFLGTI